jgi:hypothetical protein
LIAVGTWMMVALPQGPPAPARAPERQVGTEATEELSVLPQATWTVKAFPAGAAGDLTKAARKATAEQRPLVAATIEKLFDALILAPDTLKDVLKKTAEAPAARALASSKLVSPPRLRNVETVRREARVGVDVTGARRAAGEVVVVLKGSVGGKPVRVKHTSQLWLERKEGRWLVIAYAGQRRPLR